MDVVGWVLISVLVGSVGMLLVSTVRLVFGPVDSRRLDIFALRQALTVTPGNGNTIIRYLATTRRWRGGLLYLDLVLSVVIVLVTGQRFDINIVFAFSGWFVGAVVAEWRVDSLARGPASAALLHRRLISDYVRRPGCYLASALWLAVPVLAIVALVDAVVRHNDLVPSVGTLLAEIVTGTAIVLVLRRILQRPQPLVAPDLLEADNAIRGRSLNVLVGCALAIGGYLGAVSIGEIVARPDSSAVHIAQLLGYLALPILGVVLGRAPRVTPVGVPARPVAA